MISKKEGWHCLAVKRLSALLKGITPNFNDNFYSLNCLYLFSTKNKIELHEKI